jgi:lysophospholipid acyltransferase (LPLAT)-like uncharacterized protein
MSVRERFEMVALSIVGSVVIRCLGYSWRISDVGRESVARAREHFPNVIYAFWHGRLLPLSFTHRNRAIQVLASEHRDGERLGQVIRRLGFGHVRGSSTRGGTRAILDLVEKLKAGFDLGITVDGPRGPKYVVKPGPIQIAKMSGAAVVPITTASKRHKTFTSWDAFELPYPFTEVIVRRGEPVIVPSDADADMIEEKRLELERELNAITKASDDGFHD